MRVQIFSGAAFAESRAICVFLKNLSRISNQRVARRPRCGQMNGLRLLFFLREIDIFTFAGFLCPLLFLVSQTECGRPGNGNEPAQFLKFLFSDAFDCFQFVSGFKGLLRTPLNDSRSQ